VTQYGQRRGRKLARRKARRERARCTRALLRAMLQHAQAALVVRHVQTQAARASGQATGAHLDLRGGGTRRLDRNANAKKPPRSHMSLGTCENPIPQST
jgi:predicted signal transduction protein with EAL and GGDEF domain